MGSLKYIHNDLLSSDRQIIAHGVNCLGAFGAGVAKQVAARFPEARWAYLRKWRCGGWKIGDVQFVEVAPRVVIANMATQYGYGRGGRQVDYAAVRSCLDQVLAYGEETGYGVAMPMVGCGLGGGDWGEVESILVRLLAGREVQVDVHVYDPAADAGGRGGGQGV